jgi:hypothetical protein
MQHGWMQTPNHSWGMVKVFPTFSKTATSTHYYCPSTTGKTCKFGHVCTLICFNGKSSASHSSTTMLHVSINYSLSYTTDLALESHIIYLFCGWHLWKLGWTLPIICVQAISQELMVRKIVWGQYNIKGNLVGLSVQKTEIICPCGWILL